MKRIKLFVIGFAVAALMLSMPEYIHARGGRSGGGWSGGRGERGYHAGGGERRGEGERGGEGRRREDDRNYHRDSVWGYGPTDVAVSGVAIVDDDDAVQPTTVIVEQPLATDTQ
jgi:hypothetical protein